MKPEGFLKHAVAAFIIALLLYLAAYSFIEHRRVRNGSWLVTFTQNSGVPMLVVSEPALAITNVQIVFPGASVDETNLNSTLDFAQPFPVPHPVPFGEIIFMDTTFLPGTVVFQMFGHEIQLIPRVLTIDKQERPWRSNEIISLPPQDPNAGPRVNGNVGRSGLPEPTSHP